MSDTVKYGVWSTMITPFTTGGRYIDYDKISEMVDFYVNNGCEGIFAVCQSSEMFYLSTQERIKLAYAVCDAAAGRIKVIVSGHVDNDVKCAAEHVNQMAQTGAQAVVLVSNRLAAEEESDDIWITNADQLLALSPGIELGLYECPFPYKRPLTDRIIDYCRNTNRFSFIKDTCCDTNRIKERLCRIGTSRIRLFNANTATLLESMHAGAAGYSGVMANFHPDLYVHLMHLAEDQPMEAEILQAFLTLAACLEARCYPISAKYHMAKSGIKMALDTRCRNMMDWTYAAKAEIEQLILLEEKIKALDFSTHKWQQIFQK